MTQARKFIESLPDDELLKLSAGIKAQVLNMRARMMELPSLLIWKRVVAACEVRRRKL